MIEVQNICKAFGNRPILDGVNLTVETGQIVNVIGASGCGKSTLLRILAGLETADSGTIQLNNGDLDSAAVTLVFQYSALFDALTVFENVAFSLTERADFGLPRTLETKKTALRQRVWDALQFVGLDPATVCDLYPAALSGGMQKRVSFARAIISQPQIILYDEPTAGLDPLASQVIEDDIVKVRQQFNTTSIVVTHQLSTIRRTADYVVLMEEGRISWTGSKAEFLQSEHPTLRLFHPTDS
jgi:phospholipid/cholesterol/gamma-HCH transport system ATP-binding protein